MTFPRANPVGWALFELLTSAQMNTLDENMQFALDGRAGGVYQPTATLEINGASVASGAALRVRNADNGPAVLMNITNSPEGLVMDGTVEGSWIQVIGTTVSSVGSLATMMILEGHHNSGTGFGGTGVSITGGNGTGTSARGGLGLSARGGNGTTFGGAGIYGYGGNNNISGFAGFDAIGTPAVNGVGGATVGNDATRHVGAAAFYGQGGDISGTARSGGYGLLGIGGRGPSLSSLHTANDIGTGVRGEGSIGVWGATGRNNSIEVDAAFYPAPIAAVRATSRAGNSVLAEHSGTSSDGYLNRFRWVGTGVGSSTKTVMLVEADLSAAPSGITTAIETSSGVNSGRVRGINAYSRGAASIRLSQQSHDGVNHPQLEFISLSQGPNVDVEGGVCYVDRNTSVVTGLGSDAFFMGHGPNTGYWDRIVGSADSAAAWAWGRAIISGGNVSLGTNYNIASVSKGQYHVDFVLNAPAGAPLSSGLCPIATVEGDNGVTASYGAAFAIILDSTTIRVMAFGTSGSLLDLNAVNTRLNLLVFGSPLFGRVATRPTFYRAD